MEQSLYIFYFMVAFIIFMLSILYDRDWQLQGLFAGISFVLFTILMILGFNIESIVYDSATSTFISYRMGDATSQNPNGTLEYLVPMGISFILATFSFLNGFIIFTAKSFINITKGLKIPRGFKRFKGL